MNDEWIKKIDLKNVRSDCVEHEPRENVASEG